MMELRIRTFGVYVIFMMLFMLVGCTSAPTSTQTAERTKQHRLIHNNDGTDALYNRWFHNRPLCKADIEAYVDMVADKQVTTYMMCSGSDFVYYRSKYDRPFGDDMGGTIGCGDDTATLRTMKRYHQNILNLEAEGTDVIEASLLRAQAKGMEAFISYRVNDLHFADTKGDCAIQYSDFWTKHPEYWLGDTTLGWHGDGALNFALKPVRDHKMNQINEQLENYAMIDGFELDFMRFIVLFKPEEARGNAPLITEMVQQVRDKIDSLSEVRGKKILLTVRVPMSIETGFAKGIDVREWARLGLVDFVTIGVHWRGDPAIPTAQFISDFGYPEIPVYVTIDDGGYRPRETFSHGMHRGMATNILAQGADGVYLFNYYMGGYMTDNNGQLTLEPGGQVCRWMMPELLNELGSLETLRGRNKLFCLTDGVSGEYLMKQYTPLPMVVAAERVCEAPIYVGDDVAQTPPQEAILFLRTDRAAAYNLYVNGEKITASSKPEYVSLYDRARGLKKGEQVDAYVLPQGLLHQGENVVKLRVYGEDDLFVVRRLDIALKYGDVKTHGYF